MEKNKILITGLPGCGKTTLVQKLADLLKLLRPAGFYTAEIRQGGTRVGFELTSLAGDKAILSHVDIESPIRVGKYRVDIGRFDDFLAKLDFENQPETPVIIDEIGKMECCSDKFVSLVETLLDSPRMLIAVVALKGGGLIETAKKRNDVVLFHLTYANRDIVFEKISAIIQK